MPIYKVTGNGKERLIEARTKEQAIGHVVGSEFKAEALGPREVADACGAGLKLEVAVVEKKPAAPAAQLGSI